MVKRIEQQEQMQGGLYIPDTPKRSPMRARSRRWGRASAWKTAKWFLWTSTWDRILFGKYSGSDIKLDGEEYMIMREDEVLGILEAAPKEAKKAS